MKFLNSLKFGNVNYTLPYEDGTANQILKTNGSGSVSWVTDETGSNFYANGATFNTSTGELTISVSGSSDVTVDLDGRYLTAHPNISAGSSQDNSGNTFIQDVTIDSNGHVTALGNGTLVSFTGATGAAAGSAGGVPAPSAGEDDEYLRGDGTWAPTPFATINMLDGASNNFAATDRSYVQFEGFTNNSGAGTVSDPYVLVPPSYSAGSGIDLSSGAFSVEADLRDGITHIGVSNNNYITFDNTNNRIDFYAGGIFVARLESDGDLHVKGDVIAFSSIF